MTSKKSLFVLILLCLLSHYGHSELIPCTGIGDCEKYMEDEELSISQVNFGNLRCQKYESLANQTFCSEGASIDDAEFIWIADCEGNEPCILNYPTAPYCHLETGKCDKHPDAKGPPAKFDPFDKCKVLYGKSYVFNAKRQTCAVPKCQSLHQCPDPSKCFRGSCEVTTVDLEPCQSKSDCRRKHPQARWVECSTLRNCETGECQSDRDCKRFGPQKQICFQKSCRSTSQCQSHDDCPGASSKCLWGLCVQLDLTSKSCYVDEVPESTTKTPLWRINLIRPKENSKCPPFLKCFDGVCRPLPCYFDKECAIQDSCLKWTLFQGPGLCHKAKCVKSDDCPPGMGCDLILGKCVQSFCQVDNDCGERFQCESNVCMPSSCTNDWECGFKHRCVSGQCFANPPSGWSERPCESRLDCDFDNSQCWRGRCVPAKCWINADCPPWMRCSNSNSIQTLPSLNDEIKQRPNFAGTCEAKPCSKENPCKPPLICSDKLCFPEACQSSYHCPAPYTCHQGKCKLTDPSCRGTHDCPVDTICFEGTCISDFCNDGEASSTGEDYYYEDDDQGQEEQSCPPGYNCVDNRCEMDKCSEQTCPDGFCSNGQCYESCEEDNDCPFLSDCIDGSCKPSVVQPGKCECSDDCPQDHMCFWGHCIKNKCKNHMHCPLGSHCLDKKTCTYTDDKECKTDFDCIGGDTCDILENGQAGECVEKPVPCQKTEDCPKFMTCSQDQGLCHFDQKPCVQSKDCPPGELCYNLFCHQPPISPIHCVHDIQCPSGQTCQDNKCQTSEPVVATPDPLTTTVRPKGECFLNKPCSKPHHYCEQNICKPGKPCPKPNVCPRDFNCINGTCIPKLNCTENEEEETENLLEEAYDGLTNDYYYDNADGPVSTCPQNQICRGLKCTKPEACLTDLDCKPTDKCIDGLEECQEIPCGNSNHDCPANYNCDKSLGICTIKACQDSKDCGSNQVCKEGKCLIASTATPCDADTDCSQEEGERCDPEAGICRPTCFNDLDCPNGQSPCSDTGFCVGPSPCKDSDNCPGNFDCVDEICEIVKCQDKSGCKPGQVCLDGKCLITQCNRRGDCKIKDVQCIDNHCVRDCATDKDCGPGGNCMKEKCVFPSDPPNCFLERHCPVQETCLNGQCKVKVFCRENEECEEDEVCQENQCRPKCKNDQDCSQDQKCDTEIGKCINQCVNEVDCPKDSHDCSRQGVCEEKDCSSSKDCPSNFECIDDVCTIKKCQNPRDCEQGQICVSGKCLIVECKKSSDCKVSPDVECKEGQCIKECSSDNDCGNGGKCIKGKCLFPSDPPNCYIDNHCSPEQICDSGQCIKEGCKDDKDCENDEVCVDDICVPRCRLDSDCLDNHGCHAITGKCLVKCANQLDCPGYKEVCIDGLCIEKLCSKPADCPDNFDCKGGVCEIKECIFDDCPEDQVCLDDKCLIPECEKDQDCKIAGMECIDNHCLKECESDNDCPPKGECIDGKCRCPTDYPDCYIDRHCPEGEDCQNGKCKKSKCNGDSDCNTNEVCENSKCRPKCRTNNDCPGSKVCDQASGKCIEECAIQLDCPSDDEVCQDPGKCFPVNCLRDRECPPNFECIKDKCIIVKCALDRDCPKNQLCIDGKCYVIECSEDSDCKIEGMECQQSQCIRECNSDNDCQPNGKCIKNKCRYPKNPPNCYIDNHCPRDNECKNGKCVKISCNQDDDCKRDELCQEGKCLPKCKDNSDCQPHQDCDLRSGRCVDKCVNQLHCQVDNHVCQNDHCIVTQCQSNRNCPPNFECIKGECYIVKCQGSDCPGTGQVCIRGKCYVPECNNPGNCKCKDCTCLDKHCHIYCQYDWDCPSKECIKGSCIMPKDPPNCYLNKHCPNDQECHDGKCRRKICSLDNDCPPGKVCEKPNCIPRCKSDLDCPKKKKCHENGKCQDKDYCERHKDCPRGQLCNLDILKCQPGCNIDKDCKPSKVCENGKCVPRCQTEHDCQDKTHFCRDGHCTNSCQTRADCPDKAQNHKICKDSQCYYIPIGCRSDDECEAPMKCVKSKCITTHCSTDEECNNLGKEGNFRCIRGNCIQSAECTGNRQCRIRHGFDHYCIKSQCRKVEVGCQSDDHCYPGYVCYRDRCIQKVKCKRTSQCPSSPMLHYCHTRSGKCIPYKPSPIGNPNSGLVGLSSSRKFNENDKSTESSFSFRKQSIKSPKTERKSKKWKSKTRRKSNKRNRNRKRQRRGRRQRKG